MESFHWQGEEILQHEEVHKIGTDAILLSGWLKSLRIPAKSILDAGTGTGVIALLLAGIYPEADILAIDIQQQAVELAAHNFKSSKHHNRLTAECRDIFRFSGHQEFDLVVSNPPFYEGHADYKESQRQIARYSQEGPSGWMKALAGLCHQEGRICIVIPYADQGEWIKCGNDQCMYGNSICRLKSFHSDARSVRSMVCFSRRLLRPEINELVLYDVKGKYSGDFLELWK